MASEPTILAFDTSAAHCAACVMRGDVVLASRVESMAKGQAERLFVLLQELLTEAELDWRDLSKIGVGIGPGNFTGIRISVAAARGLALSLGVPAIGVSGFEVAAMGAALPLTTTVRAPRDRVYVQHWSKDGTATTPDLCDALASEDRQQALEDIPLATRVERIALIAAQAPDTTPPPAPLYIRPADAAPPRDPAPVILPE